MKEIWKPGTMIYPVPAVMVSCGVDPSEYNIITVSWTGTICTNPPMCYISLRPERHSYEIIKRSGDFVINLSTEALAYAADWCGVKSGRNVNKFEAMRLTPKESSIVKAPIIEESPVNIECRVKDIVSLGSHDMFISEVMAVQASKEYIEESSGVFRFDMAGPICYSHGKYYLLGKNIGKFGFSVQKKKKKNNHLNK
jgi:flavin reductase (DIM6/NTAB) family NADH-FMN oxidoreductase RutF